MRLRNKIFWRVSSPKYLKVRPQYLKVLDKPKGFTRVNSNVIRNSLVMLFAKPRTKII